MSQNLHIVSVATEQKFYMKYLISSIKNNNGELVILGYNQKWQGFNWRNILMKDYLKKLDPNDIVCFIDGYDVFCLRDLRLLKAKFIEIIQREKAKIIVGYDNIKNFMDSIVVPIGYGKCKNTSLNAGTYIGYVKDILNMIDKIFVIDNNITADDQVLLTKFCNSNKDYIYIDIKNELFLTLSDKLKDISNYLTITNNNEVIYNNNKPFFLHTPSSFFDILLKKLGYKIDDSISKAIIDKHYIKNPISRYINYLIFNIDIISIIIFLLLLLIIFYK
jgi:hypothetical protein